MHWQLKPFSFYCTKTYRQTDRSHAHTHTYTQLIIYPCKCVYWQQTGIYHSIQTLKNKFKCIQNYSIWLGGRKGIRPVKNLSDGMLVWLSFWSEVHLAHLMLLPLSVYCFSKSRLVLVSAHPGNPEQNPQGCKNGCACVCSIESVNDNICIPYKSLSKHSVHKCQHLE